MLLQGYEKMKTFKLNSFFFSLPSLSVSLSRKVSLFFSVFSKSLPLWNLWPFCHNQKCLRYVQKENMKWNKMVTHTRNGGIQQGILKYKSKLLCRTWEVMSYSSPALILLLSHHLCTTGHRSWSLLRFLKSFSLAVCFCCCFLGGLLKTQSEFLNILNLCTLKLQRERDRTS